MRVARYLVLATFAAAAFVGVSAPSNVSAQGKPRIFFVSPKNGASVKSPVHLEFGIENYKIAAVPDGTVTTARPGVGHFHLGIDVEKAKRLIMVATAASVGAAVAVSGIIGFVGLGAPHVVRILAGPDHRIVLPGSALLGATMVLLADVAARMIVRPAELPIGIVMAAIGAPVFLHLVTKRGIGGME